MVFLW